MPKLAAALCAHHEELDLYGPNIQDAGATRIAGRLQLTQQRLFMAPVCQRRTENRKAGRRAGRSTRQRFL